MYYLKNIYFKSTDALKGKHMSDIRVNIDAWDDWKSFLEKIKHPGIFTEDHQSKWQNGLCLDKVKLRYESKWTAAKGSSLWLKFETRKSGLKVIMVDVTVIIVALVALWLS